VRLCSDAWVEAKVRIAAPLKGTREAQHTSLSRRVVVHMHGLALGMVWVAAVLCSARLRDCICVICGWHWAQLHARM